jgi:hypothetical protein
MSKPFSYGICKRDMKLDVVLDASGNEIDPVDLLNEQAATILRMERALTQIKDHHTEGNKKRGRPVERSKTIAFCNQGLGVSA